MRVQQNMEYSSSKNEHSKIEQEKEAHNVLQEILNKINFGKKIPTNIY